MIDLLNSGTLIATFGLLGLLAVVFVETGLLLGFFLPGDSLLFTAGVLAAQLHPAIPLWLLLATVPVAAIVGDQCGFMIGAKAGPAVFDRPDARRLGAQHLQRAREFFARHGAVAVVAARFIPVLRTLTPVLAGASGLPRRTFLRSNVAGGVAWGAGVPLLGYLLGGVALVRDHIDVALIAVVAVSVAPLVIGYLRSRLGRRVRPAVTAARRLAVAEPALAGLR
ncbi:DedA family protein [Mycobacterium sp. M1]|uniref:DedA family protein n=1 Tax=Mycolicibacter acidiphilus TaxID=2835306 RepID=A0ABS5RI92_9MYCO|nr:DedA family protein [Mycolicibacter acidiphilus]MBS9534016.1 DedA family protein [Mycolicibacter acidiphilus]